MNNHAHVLKPLDGMSVDYLNSCLAFYDFVPLTAGTTGRRKLNKSALLDAPLRLAPPAEQQEIVRVIQHLFSLADKIEKRLKTATERAEKMMQSVLAKAFRGELVPTEAELAGQEGREYETAEALLERVRGDRADGQPSAPTRRSVRNGGTSPSTQSRTRANMIYDKFVEIAGAEFEAVEGVEVSWDRSFLRLLFDGQISLRFKKFNKALRSSNVRTNAQRAVYFQLELESFPPAPTEVILGYVLDESGAEIERVCITCPIGWSEVKWVIPVMEPPADARSLFDPAPQPAPTAPAADIAPPLVTPKRGKQRRQAE